MCLGVFEMDENSRSDMHFAAHLTSLPLHPTHNTSTTFLILTERDVTYFDTSVSLSYILQVLTIPRSFYKNRSASREMKKRNQCVPNLCQ